MPSSYHNMRTVPPSFSPVVCKSVESIDDQSISPSMLGSLPPALGPSCLSVLGLLFAYVHNFLLFTSWGGKSDIVVETVSLSRGQYYLKQTHRQNQASQCTGLSQGHSALV